jgi:hypothetical protein
LTSDTGPSRGDADVEVSFPISIVVLLRRLPMLVTSTYCGYVPTEDSDVACLNPSELTFNSGSKVALSDFSSLLCFLKPAGFSVTSVLIGVTIWILVSGCLSVVAVYTGLISVVMSLTLGSLPLSSVSGSSAGFLDL